LTWARDHGAGRVGAEWDFRLAPPGERRRPLVPDVAYLSYERVGYDDDEGASIPIVAPNAVVEILSPGDQRRDVEEKIQVYLAAGTDVVFIVDPVRERVDAHSVLGLETFLRGDIVTHRSLVGFVMKFATIYEKVPPRGLA
jgi:Uma2 family endonuclease